MKMYFDSEKPKPNAILEKPKSNTINTNYFNKNMNYYICGSGGCGSTILFKYLSNFGNVYHIHDRYPPEKLCYVGKENTTEDVYTEWFNKTEIPENKLNSYKVIFIYRNPIDVIFSRCVTPSGPNVNHLRHIKCINDGVVGLGDVITSGIDLYGLEEFFDNYTIPKNRNYKIYAVKYENLFYNMSLFNKVLGIPDIKAFYPIKYERNKKLTHLKELSTIYYGMIMKMRTMPFINIVNPINKEITDNDNKINSEDNNT